MKNDSVLQMGFFVACPELMANVLFSRNEKQELKCKIILGQ